MSKEVKGKPEGYTLLQATEEGEGPVPGQLTFPEWQRWRKSVGLRPTTRVDGHGTSTREEVALWEAIMESRYGRDAFLALADDEASEDGSGENADGGSRGQDAADATATAVGPPAAAGVDGFLTGITGMFGEPAGGAPQTPAARRTLRATPSAASAASDSSQSGVATLGVLQERLFKLYDPAAETLEEYKARVDRMVTAMETFGQDTDGDAVVLLLDKAEVLFQVWEAMGRKAYRPSEGIKILRDMFVAVATDNGLSQDDRELRAAAIAGLVTAQGGKESTDPDSSFC